MSRFTEGDWPEDAAEIMAMGRFIVNSRRVIEGRRGQKVLRELESFLQAMPEKRLISGWLATPDGEVCTVGLYCAAKRAEMEGKDVRTVAAEMAMERLPERWEKMERTGPGTYSREWRRDWGAGEEVYYREEVTCDDEGNQPTLDAGKAAGLAETLAYVLGDLNDETLRRYTPEERWANVLAWVQARIKADADV